ncbi:MAG: DEAD/DEAH box helicase, partial [Nitrospiraceae bacterium]
LDDAPLEERRARAVEMRRSLPPQLAGEIGALDPTAIAEVAEESWPVVRDSDELHDALLTLVWVPEAQATRWGAHLPMLIQDGRATVVRLGQEQGAVGHGWVATEHLELVCAAFPGSTGTTELNAVVQEAIPDREEAVLKIVRGWMESTGPTTAEELAETLDLPTEAVQASFLQLETEGQVLRGRFRQPVTTAGAQATEVRTEWCNRRLLARIHRLTIGRLRREIEPVTAADFMRFLFQWQHVAPGSRLHGEAGLFQIIRQLAGFEASATAWERNLLPLRLSKYNAELLDRLCLVGSVMWGRLTPHPRLEHDPAESRPARIIATSASPVGLFPREDVEWLLRLFREGVARGTRSAMPALSPVAHDLYKDMGAKGASFFADLVRATNHLPSEVENGLWELAAAGLVTADGFDNLRALLDPRRRRAEGRERGRRPRHSAGRWSLLRQGSVEPGGTLPLEQVALQLLRRYGVVFRDLLGRESLNTGWRELLVQYRRLESRGEIRGGRFVSGFTGEQFALPEAVESLRAMRKVSAQPGGAASQEIKISAADPLNLIGVILPGPRVPASPSNFVVFRDGIPVRSGTMRDGSDSQMPSINLAQRGPA